MNIVSNPKYTSLIKDLHSFQRKLINPQKAVFCLVMTFQCKSLKQKRYIFTLVKLPPTDTLFTGTQTPYQNEHCFYILLYILLYTIVHFALYYCTFYLYYCTVYFILLYILLYTIVHFTLYYCTFYFILLYILFYTIVHFTLYYCTFYFILLYILLILLYNLQTYLSLAPILASVMGETGVPGETHQSDIGVNMTISHTDTHFILLHTLCLRLTVVYYVC